MEYTALQKRFLKERFYRWVLNASVGEQLNWRNASERLEDITGVKISAETLRQNFQPVSIRAGKKRREFTDPKRWQALHDFLIDPAVRYLTDRQLMTPAMPAGAAIAMDEFINPTGITEQEGVLLRALQGRFIGEVSDEHGSDELVLDITYEAPEKLTTVSFHSLSDDSEADVESASFSGWLVSGSGGFALMILRSAYQQDAGALIFELVQTTALPDALEATTSHGHDAILLASYRGMANAALAPNLGADPRDPPEQRYTIPEPDTDNRYLLTREPRSTSWEEER